MGLLPGVIQLSKITRLVHLALCGLFFATYAVPNIQYALDNNTVNAFKLEQGIKQTLEKIPPDSLLLGYTNGLAPRWSFFARETFGVANREPVLLPMLQDKRSAYLFFEDQRQVEPAFSHFLLEYYELEKIYSYGDFEAYQILGLSDKGKTYSSDINFSDPESNNSYTNVSVLEEAHLYGNWAMELREVGLFIDNSKGSSEFQLEFSIEECRSNYELWIAMLRDGLEPNLTKIPLTAGESNEVLPIPENLKGQRFTLYLMKGKSLPGGHPACETPLPRMRSFLNLKRARLLPPTSSISDSDLE